MGTDIKTLRSRIHSVDSTLHLTTAMGLVASSKMRRADMAMNSGRQYAAAVTEIMSALAACPECRRSPYLRTGGDRTRLIVIAGDRGLCGGYNANVFRLLQEHPDAEYIPIGKRACDRCGSGYASAEAFSTADAEALAEKLCREFAAGEYDRLGILCTGYVSMMQQVARVKWVLPLEAGKTSPGGIIFEPNAETILSNAVKTYVGGMITACVRESFASEVAARRMAMDSAGRNAREMISELRLEYNRARQSAITQEITEIVAGSGE